MKNSLLLTALLAALVLPGNRAARAGEPERLTIRDDHRLAAVPTASRVAAEEIVVAAPPAGVVVHDGEIVSETVIIDRPATRFGRRGGVNVLQRGPNPPRAFIHDGYRYEPKIRDIRLLPRERTLPEGNFGARETLPVLPHREAGYFVLPH